MKREEMNAIIHEDLTHIHYGPHGSPQRMLHGTFTQCRQAQLGEKGDPSRSRGDVFKEAVTAIRTNHADFQPDYDHDWFGELE
jgi:hypothetical protein